MYMILQFVVYLFISYNIIFISTAHKTYLPSIWRYWVYEYESRALRIIVAVALMAMDDIYISRGCHNSISLALGVIHFPD